VVDVTRRAELHHVAEVHHRDAVADVLDHREVVGDEQVREAELLLEVLEEIEHLRLDRDVESRDRLVGDQQTRRGGQRTRDADALALAARELVRVAKRLLAGQADLLEARRRGPRGPAREVRLGHQQRLRHDVPDRPPRVERRVGILIDHLHLGAVRTHLDRDRGARSTTAPSFRRN
jgi:hypothetical protein